MKTKLKHLGYGLSYGIDKEKGYYCCICNKKIAKYQMDLKCCEIKTKKENKLICDDCAKQIAKYVVEEF